MSFEKECEKLLSLHWKQEEHILIKKILENVLYYKKLMPKELKKDIQEILLLTSNLKIEHEILVNKFKELKNLN